ncbi:MAG: hypothetical protein JSU61_08980 [Fidelibacterota bacterium]|nr:MAG: hypothetical protein JSU61_08980 [Candidatus Neomarinimicrobiota bacterium]
MSDEVLLHEVKVGITEEVEAVLPQKKAVRLLQGHCDRQELLFTSREGGRPL